MSTDGQPVFVIDPEAPAVALGRRGERGLPLCRVGIPEQHDVQVAAPVSGQAGMDRRFAVRRLAGDTHPRPGGRRRRERW